MRELRRTVLLVKSWEMFSTEASCMAGMVKGKTLSESQEMNKAV